MDNIQLLYVANNVTGKAAACQQSLLFLMRVADLDYDKQVDVLWAGEDGVWHFLPALFNRKAEDGQEYWQAEIAFPPQPHADIPGDIRFALRLQAAGSEYWDNNEGGDYFSGAGSGARLTSAAAMLQLSHAEQLQDGQHSVPVKLAVDAGLEIDHVTIHWTIDNWQHSHTSSCRRQAQRKSANKAVYAGLHLAQVWSGRIRVGDAFRLQYSICCESKQQRLWDNNAGQNYFLSRTPLRLLILNLHCYQEEDQDRKFWQIANAIDELGADLVCFQEVAEYWNDGRGDWPSNSANIINQRLPKPFHLYTDWSHLGFDKFREGVAILSRHPLAEQEARYVSDSHDAYSIHSRKVVSARIKVPYIGTLDVFSAHLSWWEDGFQQQFQRLSAWADDKRSAEVDATLLCGDFNIAAGSTGYQLVVNGHQYEDQYLAANAPALFEQIFRVNDAYWRDYLADDYRIDYIFMDRNSGLRASSARTVFTEQDYGPVSDHCGYLMTFEPL